MAVLKSGTTIGGYTAVHSNNISTYALTSLPSHTHDDRYYTETESDGRYLYYRGYSTSGNTQTFQSTPNTLRFDQVGALSNGSWSNQPTGYYTYGGILSLRGESFGLQIYGSHTGDLAFKTQWDNDQYIGWRTIITSANIGSQSVSYASSAGNADTVDSLHASSFVRSDQNAVTIQRHLDASTTWTNSATTLFLGWYGGKVVIGNNNNGNHDAAAGLGGNTVISTNPLYAPIIYDLNDTGYYLDPNGESNLWRFTAQSMTRNAINYLSINSPYVTRSNQAVGYLNGTMGWGTTDLNAVFSNWGSGFIDSWGWPGNRPNDSTSHWVGLQTLHYNHQNSAEGYGWQMVNGANTNRWYLRQGWPGLSGWQEIIHSGNIGSQSVNYATSAGDASTLGGLSSGKYPKQDYYYSSGQDWNTIEAAGTDAALILRVESAVANPPANDVYNWSLWQQGTRSRGSQIAVSAYGEPRMYFRGSNFDSGAYNSWNEIIHSGNIGSQSVSYATSAGNSSTTSQIVFSDLKTNFPSGAGGGHSFGSNHYSMGLDVGNGGWSHPHYRDVIIGYHTGIRIGANYSGIRFYNNSPTTDANNDGNGDGGESLLMTIGGYVGTANHTDVVVNNNLFANASMRAPIFYDSNDTGYYLDPNSTLLGLKIAGNIDMYARSASWAEGIRVRVPSTSTWGGIRFTRDRGNDDGNWAIGYTGIDSTDDLTFWGNSGGTGAMRARLDQSSNLITYGSMRSPQFRVTNSTNNAYITGNSDWGLAIVNDNGFIQFGPANNSWSHIYSDKSFYFNQELYVNGTQVVKNSGTWGINVTGNAGASSRSSALDIVGYGSGNMTYYQTSGTFAGYSGWAGYFVSNHGDGATYYNQTIIMPFWGPPQYSRLQGGTFAGPYTFWSTENLNDYAPNMNQYVRTSDNVTFNTTTSPTILVNNHSDNTKGYRIHNTSGTSVSAMFTNSSNQLVIAAGAVDQINLNKKVYVNSVALGVNVSPSATAGRIDASNDIVAYSSSDERLKHNITPIENALDKVKSLTGVEFDWKPEYKQAHGYEGHDTGIIAQQVQAVIPSAVRTNDTGFLAVRYEKLIGLLIEANKELAARVEELEKETRVMALQSSGAISIGNIRTELGSSSGALRTLSALAGKSTPDAMSEFYGYSSATEFQISEIGFPDAEQCCVEGPNFGTGIVYSASTSLGVNVALFTNSSLTEAFDGNDKWWYSSGKSYLINTAGKIDEVFIC